MLYLSKMLRVLWPEIFMTTPSLTPASAVASGGGPAEVVNDPVAGDLPLGDGGVPEVVGEFGDRLAVGWKTCRTMMPCSRSRALVLSSRDLNTIVDDDVRRPRLPGAGQKAIGVKIHFAGLLEMAPSAG